MRNLHCFFKWCPRQESNLQLLLRTELLYPFNYGDHVERSETPSRHKRDIGRKFLILSEASSASRIIQTYSHRKSENMFSGVDHILPFSVCPNRFCTLLRTFFVPGHRFYFITLRNPRSYKPFSQ